MSVTNSCHRAAIACTAASSCVELHSDNCRGLLLDVGRSLMFGTPSWSQYTMVQGAEKAGVSVWKGLSCMDIQQATSAHT